MPAQTIGIVALPQLAHALQAQGYAVVTGTDFRDAASNIRLAFQTGQTFPIIVGDDADTHSAAPIWLKTTATKTPIAVVATSTATGLSADGLAASHEAPVNVAELLVSVDMPLPGEAVLALTLEADGSLSRAGHPEQAAVPDTPAVEATATQSNPVLDDPWAQTPDLGHSRAVPQETVPQPMPEPVEVPPPLDASDLDPFADEPAAPAQPAPTGQSVPASAPAVFDDETFSLDEDEDDEEDFDFDDDPAPARPAVAEPFTEEEEFTPPAPAPTPVTAPVTGRVEPGPPAPPAARQVPARDATDEIPAVHAPIPGPIPGPVQAPPPAPPAAEPASALSELDDLFDTGHQAGIPAPAARSGRRGEVLIVMSAKGGVGKSTTSLNLAQYAAEYGPEGYRVTLIDANRGQGDVRTYLRLHNARTATIYDSARTGEPATGLLTPSDIAQYRDARWGSVDFALIPAPPSSLADPEVVTAQVYADAIAYAREVSDLVIIDTQISEEHDTTNLWERALIPLLREGAWCLAITQPIPPAVKNLIERLQWFDQIGIGPARIMSFVNMVETSDAETADALVVRLRQVSTCLGWVPQDPAVESASSLGRFVTDNTHFGPILASALSNVTGLPGYDPERHVEEPVGLLGRLLGRRKGR